MGMLKENKGIEKLWLTDNEITDKGMEAFIEALKVNKYIVGLYLSENNLSLQMKEQIKTISNNHQSLMHCGYQIDNVFEPEEKFKKYKGKAFVLVRPCLISTVMSFQKIPSLIWRVISFQKILL